MSRPAKPPETPSGGWLPALHLGGASIGVPVGAPSSFTVVIVSTPLSRGRDVLDRLTFDHIRPKVKEEDPDPFVFQLKITGIVNHEARIRITREVTQRFGDVLVAATGRTTKNLDLLYETGLAYRENTCVPTKSETIVFFYTIGRVQREDFGELAKNLVPVRDGPKVVATNKTLVSLLATRTFGGELGAEVKIDNATYIRTELNDVVPSEFQAVANPADARQKPEMRVYRFEKS
jgi:hypothetical protein